MSTAKTICILFVCSLAAPFAGAQSDFRVIVTFKKPPIYLPRTTFWKYALPPIAEAAAGDDELSVAYRTYLMHDRLSGRAYLNPVLQKGAKDAGPLEDLRPLSLECLLEMPDSPDHFLVSTARDDGSNGQGASAAGGGVKNPAPLGERLLSARVKKTAGIFILRSCLGLHFSTGISAMRMAAARKPPRNGSAWRRAAPAAVY